MASGMNRAASFPPISGDTRVGKEPVGTVKYMGSKRGLVAVLAPEIAAFCEPDERVVDLFAGTHAVGYALKDRNRVVGVDVQHYSRILGSALLCDRLDQPVSDVLDRLHPHLAAHVEAVEAIYRAPLAQEQRLLRALRAAPEDPAAIAAYSAFQTSLPDPSDWSVPGHQASSGLHRVLGQLVKERRGSPDTFPYVLLTTYYANAYFGVEQAIVLDGLRYAIDQEFSSGSGRDLCLAALLSAASHATSTPGHFAMWRLTRSGAAATDIARYRARDPLAYFATKLAELLASSATNAPDRHAVFAIDATRFVSTYEQTVAAVYIDPPYSAVHYSRFYHVLEELADYDYPPVFFGGRFPADRYISPWSVRSQAAGAFGALLDTVASRGWPALISYGPRGVISEATLIRLCQRAYGNSGITLRHVATRHASMGRADRGARPIRELLIRCRPSLRRRAVRGLSAR